MAWKPKRSVGRPSAVRRKSHVKRHRDARHWTGGAVRFRRTVVHTASGSNSRTFDVQSQSQMTQHTHTGITAVVCIRQIIGHICAFGRSPEWSVCAFGRRPLYWDVYTYCEDANTLLLLRYTSASFMSHAAITRTGGTIVFHTRADFNNYSGNNNTYAFSERIGGWRAGVATAASRVHGERRPVRKRHRYAGAREIRPLLASSATLSKPVAFTLRPITDGRSLHTAVNLRLVTESEKTVRPRPLWCPKTSRQTRSCRPTFLPCTTRLSAAPSTTRLRDSTFSNRRFRVNAFAQFLQQNTRYSHRVRNRLRYWNPTMAAHRATSVLRSWFRCENRSNHVSYCFYD